MGVIYITHRLEELRAIGDRVTILRDGATVHTGALAEITTDRIIQYMVGREMVAIYQREPLPPGASCCAWKGLPARALLARHYLSRCARERSSDWQDSSAPAARRPAALFSVSIP